MLILSKDLEEVSKRLIYSQVEQIVKGRSFILIDSACINNTNNINNLTLARFVNDDNPIVGAVIRYLLLIYMMTSKILHTQ